MDTFNLLLKLWPWFVGLIALVVWLVRLEGKIGVHDKAIVTLEDKAKGHDETKLEVVRVQEQIKQLKELLERYLDEVHRGR